MPTVDRLDDPERLGAILRAGPKLIATAAEDTSKYSSVLRGVRAELEESYCAARRPLMEWAQDPGALRDVDVPTEAEPVPSEH